MTNIDDDLRAAREWLELACHPECARKTDAIHRATIQRRLDMQPCPKGSEVPKDVLREMEDAYADSPSDGVGAMRAAIDTLHAHLTAPPPKKKVETWGLVFANGIVIQNANREYLRILSCSHPGSRVIKLVEAADADA